jgi:hypothetical protein
MRKPLVCLTILALFLACSTPVALAADQCSASCSATANQCLKQAAEDYGRCTAVCKPGPAATMCERGCTQRNYLAVSRCRAAESSCQAACSKNSGTGNGSKSGSSGKSGHK